MTFQSWSCVIPKPGMITLFLSFIFAVFILIYAVIPIQIQLNEQVKDYCDAKFGVNNYTWVGYGGFQDCGYIGECWKCEAIK